MKIKSINVLIINEEMFHGILSHRSSRYTCTDPFENKVQKEEAETTALINEEIMFRNVKK